jgi:hypothetical protein
MITINSKHCSIDLIFKLNKSNNIIILVVIFWIELSMIPKHNHLQLMIPTSKIIIAKYINTCIF